MGDLLVKEKEIVVPGDELASGMDFLPAEGTYREGESILASRLGLVTVDKRLIKVIPLSGIYLPKRGDVVIGRITDMTLGGWRVDIRGPYSSMLSIRDATSDYIPKGADLSKYFGIGEWISTGIFNASIAQNIIDLTMKSPGLRKLGEGRIIYVSPNKVPRIIGKQGSMLSMIRDATGCRITVGQNGVIWLQGEPRSEMVAVETIRKIEAEAHIQGLTERIQKYLEKKKESKENGLQEKA